MLQIILVAGVDYEWHGVDFRVLCANRRKVIERANTARAPLRFTTFDVRKGEVEVREVAFVKGKRVESVSSTTPFDPVTKASYAPNAAGSIRLKPGLWKVMGVTDIWDKVVQIGSTEGGTLAELSFFSHGWMGGPILVNSEDDRTFDITIPMPDGSTVVTPMATSGLFRDRDDKDPRSAYDFSPPQLDAAALAAWTAAFTADGFVWLWGCAFPTVVHHLLWAMERGKGYNSTTVGDDTVIAMPDVALDDVDYLDQLLVGLQPPFPAPRSSISVKFKVLRYALCRANAMSYAARMAVATGIPVRAAPLGTYAEYDAAGDRLMNVHSGFTGHFAFYKNHLGLKSDPEGRRYAIYPKTFGCTAPTLP